MLERAFAAGVPAAWGTADEVYGRDGHRRHWLEEQRKPYVLAGGANQFIWGFDAGIGPVQRRVDQIAAGIPQEAWARMSVGAGAQGPRLYDWAWIPLGVAVPPPGWRRWLLVRRSVQAPDALASYLAAGPEETSLEDLAWVAGQRWTIEESLEEAKGEVGLDAYAVRRWEGWHRHMTLALLAHAFLAVVRAAVAAQEQEEEEAEQKKGGPDPGIGSR